MAPGRSVRRRQPQERPEFLSREMAENNSLGVLKLTSNSRSEALVDMGISEVLLQRHGLTDPDQRWVLQDPSAWLLVRERYK